MMELLQSVVSLQPGDSLQLGDSLQNGDSLDSGVLGPGLASIATATPELLEAALDDQLLKAVLDGDLDSARKALANGANIHMRSKLNYTPIMHAVSLGDSQMLELLLENKANVSDDYGAYNVLMVLCDSSTCTDELSLLKCLQLLLDHGADPTTTDWMGATPLLHAVRQNRMNLALRLIVTGCSINTPDSEGWTPIFYAVHNNSLTTVQMLIDCKAKINLIDRSGRTLRDVAMTVNNAEIIKLVTTDLKPELAQPDSAGNKKARWTRSSQYRRMLAEGPKLGDRVFGFHDDAIQFLRGIGLEYVASVMSTKNLQFYELLTWGESDWTKAGINLSYHQRKILTCVRQYHEKEWSRSAIPDLSHVYEGGQVDLFKVVLALASFVRMSHINMATCRYLLENYPVDGQIPMTEETLEQLRTLSVALAVIKKQIPIIVKICQEIEKQDNCECPDFIGKSSIQKKRSTLFRVPLVFGSIACAVAISYLLSKNVSSNMGRFFSR
uniref:Ankyrin repeat, SAM and basic leucine zipper domain-containing protein 1 n=2 Tax=Lygus hesperus TaxID=30085 RepID=A0A146M829_LYGHE